MTRFLSTEWVSALGQALQDAGVTTDGAPPLVIQQLVTHEDGTRSAYRIRLDSDGAEAVDGVAPDATVVYRQSYEVARGIAEGDLDAHVEFLMGRVVVSGDTKALMDYRETLELLHAALADLRAGTEF
ncbi:MAG: hypothetical protein OXG52_08090 [bacterium]|nr:hypothetical protein [bacterium]